ncbi:hypothetical protein AAG906_037914 [Vitis piasezkii]
MVKTAMAGANRGSVIEESTDTSQMPSTIAPTISDSDGDPRTGKTRLPRWHDLRTSKDRSFIHNLVCKQQYCHVMACELHE